MNTYLIKTPAVTFTVTACDSDFACWEANEEAQRIRLYNPGQKAELILCIDDERQQSLGEIDLAGYVIPTTWAAIRLLKSDLFAEAKQMARTDWDLPVIRSRGAVLVVTDGCGAPLITSGDCYALPTSLTDFRNTTASIKARYPDAHQIFICLGCDSAASVTAMNDGDYAPWTGEAEALIYQYN
jgi:hypothetical protein